MNNISLKNFQNKLLFVVAFLIMTLTFAYNFLDTDNTMYEGFQQDSESLAEGALYAGKFGLEMQHFGLGSLEGLAFHPGYNMNELNDLFAVESNIPFVNNTYTRTYLVIGNLLKFSDGITLKISDVQVSDDKYIIKLDKPSSENDQLNTFIEHYEFLDSDGNTLPNKHINIYPSQYGLQGKVYYYLARLFPVTTEGIKLILSALLAVVLLIIVQGINKKYDSTMAVCWYIVFLLSPWIVSFSNNLYWVSFTWFLPMAVALYCPKDNKRFIFYALLFAAVFIKCLCGYEYISTIMLSMIVFPVVTWLKSPAGKERNISLQNIIFLGGFAVLAFVAAVGWHAYQVGVGNLQEGISTF